MNKETHKCTRYPYATMELDNGILCQLAFPGRCEFARFVMQVDGSKGSAMVGLRECRTQSIAETPRPVWNPMSSSPSIL